MLEAIIEIRENIFLLVETIFFDFLARGSSFSVSRNRIFQEMLEKAFFLSSGNLFLNESFIPAIGEGYFSLMKTVTLLESLFLLAETVTAVSGNQFLKIELVLAGEN